MEKIERISTFNFEGYAVDEIRFERNIDFNQEDSNMDIMTQVSVSVDDEARQCAVTLVSQLFCDDTKPLSEKPFTLQVRITGKFSTDESVEINQFNDLCRKNAPAILFPFLRSIVADITKSANVMPVILPIMNLSDAIPDKQIAE